MKTLACFEEQWQTHSPNSNFMRPTSKPGRIRLYKYIGDTSALFSIKTNERIADVSKAKRLDIKITRLSSGTLDSDNLRQALKPVRDGIARGLRLPDDKDSDTLSWDYEQIRCRRGYHGVIVEIKGGE